MDKQRWVVLYYDSVFDAWTISHPGQNSEEYAIEVRDNYRSRGITAIACTTEYLSDCVPNEDWGKKEGLT